MIFFLILAAIVIATMVGFFLLNYAGKFYALTIWAWFAADSKANIINREYGTSYTREEIFYASDVIDTIRQIDRKRIEVNGDLMREKADK